MEKECNTKMKPCIGDENVSLVLTMFSMSSRDQRNIKFAKRINE
jgi:hypothetical protein